MIISKDKAICFVNKLLILLVLFMPFLLSAQSMKNNMPADSSNYSPSQYTFGINIGYTGLFKGSGLTEIAPGKDYIDGMSFGFLFEYNFEGTKAALQILSETHQLNIDWGSNNNDKNEMSSFNLIGIKAFTGILEGIYVIPAVGIMTGKKTQFVKSVSLGYEFQSKKSVLFYQISYAETDYKDRFLMLSLGIGINL